MHRLHFPTARLPVPVVVVLLAAALALLVAAPAVAGPRPATQIVRLHPGTSLLEGRALVRAAGGHVTGTLPIINAVAARMSAGSVAAIARNSHVAAVTANSGVAPQAVTSPPVDAAADPALTAAADPAVTAPADPAPSPSGGTPQAAVDTSRLASAYPDSVFAPSAWGA